MALICRQRGMNGHCAANNKDWKLFYKQIQSGQIVGRQTLKSDLWDQKIRGKFPINMCPKLLRVSLNMS